MIEQLLQEEIERWEFLGHPAIMQRVVLKAGKLWTPAMRGRDFPRMEPKQCFHNSMRTASVHGLRYVEGYAVSAEVPGFLIHHAWNADSRGRVVDRTWSDPENSWYFGVEFTLDEWDRETNRTGTLSVFDGAGLNMKLMYRLMPELPTLIAAVRQGGTKRMKDLKDMLVAHNQLHKD